MSAGIRCTYVADDTLADLFRRYLVDVNRVIEDVRLWNEEHPDVPDLFLAKPRIGEMRYIVRGFYFKGLNRDARPAGLRCDKGSQLMTPYKDKRGDEWRALLATAPKMSEPWTQQFLDLDVTLEDWADDHYIYGLRSAEYGGKVYFWQVKQDSKHLTEIKVSEFYAAKERHEEAKDGAPR